MTPTLSMRSAHTTGSRIVEAHVASDQIKAMKRQEERSTAVVCDYLEAGVHHINKRKRKDPSAVADTVPQNTFASDIAVNQDSRMKICGWLYQVVDCFKLNRETVGIAMSYLDIFSSTSSGKTYLVSKVSYQLAAITSLHMAVKIHETVELDPTLLLQLGRGCYTLNEIAQTESAILKALNWKMHGPTPVAFIQSMMALLPRNTSDSARNSMFEIARYQAEMAVFSYSLASVRASSIAAASVLNAMESIDRRSFGSSSRVCFLQKLSEDCGIDRRMNGVSLCKSHLASRMGVPDQESKIKQRRLTRKSRIFLLQRCDGSRNLSPVSIAS